MHNYGGKLYGINKTDHVLCVPLITQKRLNPSLPSLALYFKDLMQNKNVADKAFPMPVCKMPQDTIFNTMSIIPDHILSNLK